MKIAVILTARASWAKLEPVCRALKARPDVELQLIACASALLERYGKVVDVVKAQGYHVTEEIYSVVEGENHVTSAIETGLLSSRVADTLHRLRPARVVVCADRHEVLGAALGARYLDLPTVHLQGGEYSGSLDNDVRAAITQLADIHCVSTQRAMMRVYGLTGSDAIHLTGCPSIDLAKQALTEPLVTSDELGGAGAPLDVTQPFVIVLQHPVTSEAASAGEQMETTLSAVGYLRGTRHVQVLALWPGEDAGASAISKVLRRMSWLHTVRNLPPQRFLRLLTQSACLVGNSSAGIREASYLGVPVVNLGSRQQGRERGPNVLDVPTWSELQIQAAMERHLDHGPYPKSSLYGKGDAGERIANVLVGVRDATEGTRLLPGVRA